MRLLLALFLGLLATVPARPCSFCADGFTRRQTLRQLVASSPIVIHGTLENATPDPSGLGGTTELRVGSAIKTEATTQGKTVVLLPRYIPTVGTNSKDYLAFCEVNEGRLDLSSGIPATAKVVDYLKAAAKQNDKDPAATLGFFFQHLNSEDATVAMDAFVELARASDADLAKAAKGFDKAKLKTWLQDPKTPIERLGVYAMLLGLCGQLDDVPVLLAMVNTKDMPERVVANLGGILAGLTMLDGKTGWGVIQKTVAENDRPLDQRLAAISAIRFFQTTRADTSKAEVLNALKAVIQQGDFADLAIEDLRRWKWWDLTSEVIAGAKAPLTKRAAVRYALQCPDDAAVKFLADVRKTDAQMVTDVEEGLKLYTLPKK